MTKITIDADLKARLLNLSVPLELCDENGALLAQVLPKTDPSHWEQPEPPRSEHEQAAHELSPRWYTTATVRKHMEQL